MVARHELEAHVVLLAGGGGGRDGGELGGRVSVCLFFLIGVFSSFSIFKFLTIVMSFTK